MELTAAEAWSRILERARARIPEQSRKEWLAAMSNYYKFRHDGSDAGINEFIAAALQKPLPPKP